MQLNNEPFRLICWTLAKGNAFEANRLYTQVEISELATWFGLKTWDESIELKES